VQLEEDGIILLDAGAVKKRPRLAFRGRGQSLTAVSREERLTVSDALPGIFADRDV